MSVLVIRKHKRFGVRRNVRIRHHLSTTLNGLLIEISLEGCRISNVCMAELEIDQLVTVEIDSQQELDGHVRWFHDGFVGLRFARPMPFSALDQLIRTCRGYEDDAGPLSSFGR